MSSVRGLDEVNSYDYIIQTGINKKNPECLTPGIFPPFYIQLVTPSVVPTAVRILISICNSNFQLSFFMFLIYYLTIYDLLFIYYFII